MLISLEDVDHVAALARLGLTPAERETLRTQLSSILAYVETLSKLDTSIVAPASQMNSLENVTRPDTRRIGLSLDDVLANAPDRQDDYVRVPAVLDEQ
jgi:aspartyl-tRNA(Asn)/glutamyl-tRNA(Gln) amidotransferase subunit C